MDLLGKKLKQQKELREKAKKPRRKQEYTPVEVDTGLDDEKGGFENDPEPGEETAIKMKAKNKPLPLPPNAKPKKTSPRPSPGVQRNSVKSSSPGNSRPKANTGMAFMQELSKKASLKAAGSEEASLSTRKVNKPLPSVPTGSYEQEDSAESDPVYANAMQTGDMPYQNCDFSGPPSATPSSEAPPTTTTSADGAGGQSEYQNINFGKQPPQTKKKPKSAGTGKPAGKNHSHSNTGHTHTSSHLNGSVDGNSAGEYQNFQFGVHKK